LFVDLFIGLTNDLLNTILLKFSPKKKEEEEEEV